MQRIFDNPNASERRKDLAQEIGERYEQNILDRNRRQWTDAIRGIANGDARARRPADRIRNIRYSRDVYRDQNTYQQAGSGVG